jgi:flagellar L-ring protein FlgH
MKTSVLIAILLCTTAGCNTVGPLESSRIKNQPFVVENALKAQKPAPEIKQGTIWRGEQASNTFYVDQRAKTVGDIITVKITEVSAATEKATTDTARNSSLQAGVPNFLGMELNQGGKLFATPDKMITASSKNDFSGSGETTRSGSLSATITARVVDVMPNGNLAIEGKRELYVNNEKKEILLQGVIRQKDIASDNSIFSTQVADAKVMYTGVGTIGEKQRPGWLSRAFDLVWPF